MIASYTGCNPLLTVAILTLGMGLNGGIYSGFKVNHLDISPRFAGILMSFTNCTANLAGLLAPVTAGYIIHGRVCIPMRNYRFFNLNLYFFPQQLKKLQILFVLFLAYSSSLARSLLYFCRCVHILCHFLPYILFW